MKEETLNMNASPKERAEELLRTFGDKEIASIHIRRTTNLFLDISTNKKTSGELLQFYGETLIEMEKLKP